MIEDESKVIQELVAEAVIDIEKENEQVYSLKKNRLDLNMNNCMKIEKLLQQFADTNDMKLFPKVLNSINETNELKNESKDLLLKNKKYLSQLELFWNDESIEIDFSCVASEIDQNFTVDLRECEKTKEIADGIIFSEYGNQDVTISLAINKFNTDECYVKIELEENDYFKLENNKIIEHIKPKATIQRIGKLVRKKDSQNLEEDTLFKFRLLIWKDDDDYIQKCRKKARRNILKKLNELENKEIILS